MGLPWQHIPLRKVCEVEVFLVDIRDYLNAFEKFKILTEVRQNQQNDMRTQRRLRSEQSLRCVFNG